MFRALPAFVQEQIEMMKQQTRIIRCKRDLRENDHVPQLAETPLDVRVRVDHV